MRLLALVTAATLTVGCSKNDSGDQVVVFAAASLTDAFEDVEAAFEKAHPGVDVKLNFAGSQSLRTQIQNGARADVFASANPEHMEALREKKLVDGPVTFAHNRLVIVVPKGNPTGIESLSDLPDAGRVVLAGENVPAGAYAEKVLASASSSADYGGDFAQRVENKVVSRETHVRQTLQKVVLGEADAAIVYATDAASAGDDVGTIPIPDEHNVIADYPIATLGGSKLGAQIIEFVRSAAGKKLLQEHGFRAD